MGDEERSYLESLGLDVDFQPVAEEAPPGEIEFEGIDLMSHKALKFNENSACVQDSGTISGHTQV